MRAAACLLAVLHAAPALAECGAVRAAAEAQRRAALAATVAARPETVPFPDCPPLGTALRRWRDARGTVRRAEMQAGGQDSALLVRQFHDAGGRLRLAVVTGGAVNGARLSHRVPFDAGRPTCETRRVTAPGYPFPWPGRDGLVLRDPGRTFSPDERCPTTD